jgi:hypothetical protein
MGKPQGCKLIRFTAELDGSVIDSIQIRGDFFAVPEEAFEELERALGGTRLENLESRFTELARQLGLELQGINGPGLAELVRAAAATADAAAAATAAATTPLAATAADATSASAEPIAVATTAAASSESQSTRNIS